MKDNYLNYMVALHCLNDKNEMIDDKAIALAGKSSVDMNKYWLTGVTIPKEAFLSSKVFGIALYVDPQKLLAVSGC